MPNFDTFNTRDSEVHNVGCDHFSAGDVTSCIMSATSTIQSPGPIVAVRMPPMHTRLVTYLTFMTVIEEYSRGGAGDLGLREADDSRGAWEETEGLNLLMSDYSLWHRLLRAFGFL
ncbi:hypothetical protein FIBSPDRAFT_936391 [Athelia psychrophila]|uniref:Uncharacterized protein n=1 Tax=Athelia psychrophila TaxID=1759441 RepID=A0A166C6F6_9AGAM|nr:hypothetical protein FIBSPDRAFT_936391 [Fibularhizoctonia sp. CBS 109695]